MRKLHATSPTAARSAWKARSARLGGAALIAGVLVPLAASPAAADVTTSFDVPGAYTYIVPAGALALSVVVAGADGSATGNSTATAAGGPGAEVSGVVLAAPGTALTVDVGGQGSQGGAAEAGGQAGSNTDCPFLCAGAGGGASDVRGLLIGAGGGGAGSEWINGVDTPLAGGAGGFPVGLPGVGTGAGGGASQTAPGTGGSATNGGTAGASGSGSVGGNGGVQGTRSVSAYFGGGGGGGVFGGGGGSAGGGGGGASWASPTVLNPQFCSGCKPIPNSGGFVNITAIGVIGGVQQLPPGPASAFCASQPGSVRVIDNDADGVHAFVYVDETSVAPGVEQVDVCFRIDANGTGVGGRFSITPTVPSASITGVGVPSVSVPTVGVPSVDSNGSYCTTPPAGSPPNHVPTSHPIDSGGLGPENFSFDAYSDGTSTAWICVQVGTLVDSRVVIPVSLPGVSLPSIGTPSVNVTPGYDVTFEPDTGTP